MKTRQKNDVFFSNIAQPTQYNNQNCEKDKLFIKKCKRLLLNRGGGKFILVLGTCHNITYKDDKQESIRDKLYLSGKRYEIRSCNKITPKGH